VPSAFKRCIAVFARAPIAGTVKTRLAAVYGTHPTLSLYRCFVEDLLATLGRMPHPVVIAFSPGAARRRMMGWLGPRYGYIPQKGAHLGERMDHAFRCLFARGYRQVVIVGADMPDLPGDRFEAAFCRLDACDAVIGPAADGGYYLIGFNAAVYDRRVFEAVSWGTATVMEETLSRMTYLALNACRLAPWYDIDLPADLTAFVRRNAGGRSLARTTMAFLNARPHLFKVRPAVR
jgi:rSAM/selenodomain-associated transferase 1